MCALAAAGVLVHHRNGRSIDLSQREKYSKLNGMQAVAGGLLADHPSFASRTCCRLVDVVADQNQEDNTLN